MVNKLQDKKVLSRALTIASIGTLIFALNVSGALAGFWRTVDGITDSGILNPTQFLYGFGVNDSGDFTYGYGYGYGYGDIADGNVLVTSSTSSTSSSGGGGGGGWRSSSSSSSTSSSGLPGITSSSTSSSGGIEISTPGGSSTYTVRTYPNEPVAPTCGTSIVNFSDISGNTFESYIIALEKRSGLNGNGNGSEYTYGIPESTVFQPNRSSTRAEYVKMILRALCIDYSDMNSTLDDFSDGAVDSWQAKVVNKAADLGWITTTNATFRVNDTISRAEALKMAMQAGILEPLATPTSSSFADVVATSWQAKYTEAAVGYGIISPNTNFRPADAISRGESSKMIMKTLFPTPLN